MFRNEAAVIVMIYPLVSITEMIKETKEIRDHKDNNDKKIFLPELFDDYSNLQCVKKGCSPFGIKINDEKEN